MCATHGRGGTAAADDLQEPVNVAGRLLLCSSPKLVSEGAFCTVILGKIKLTQSLLLPDFCVCCRIKQGVVSSMGSTIHGFESEGCGLCSLGNF